MKETFRPIVIASLIAAAVNQVLYFVATGFFEVSFTLTTPATMPIPFFAPALLSIGQGIVGGFIVAWIASSTRSPKNVWLSISLIALALSFCACPVDFCLGPCSCLSVLCGVLNHVVFHPLALSTEYECP